MADYQNVELKLVNLGLQLALPTELVPQGQYTHLVNVRTLKEGQMTTRNGYEDLRYDLSMYGEVRYMTHLSDTVLLFVTADGDVLYGENGDLSVVTIPEEVREMGRDRDIPRIPLKLVDDYTGEGTFSFDAITRNITRRVPQLKVDNISSVRFTSPFSGDDWTYLATDIGMFKIQVIQGTEAFQPSTVTAFRWGIRPPLVLDYVSDTEFEFLPAPLVGEQVSCPPAVDPESGDEDCDCGLDTTTAGSIRYEWVYTYYSSYTGSESGPNSFMEETWGIKKEGDCCPCATGNSGEAIRQTIKLTGFLPSADPQVDRIRLYRKGGQLALYTLEEELPWNVESYTCWKYDTRVAASLILLDFDRDVPFTTVEPTVLEDGYEPGEIPAGGAAPVDEGDEVGVQTARAIFETPLAWTWGPYAGRYLFACGDPERPGVVYWTKGTPAPDNAGEIYATQVSSSAEPLINGFIFGGEAYVWTTEKLYALDWNGFASLPEFTPREIPLGMGISSPKAFTTSPQGVFFLSKDGIFKTDCASYAEPITKDTLRPIFLGKEAFGLKPIDWTRSSEFLMEVASQEFHFLYHDTEGERKHLIFDIQHNRWQEFQLAWQIQRESRGEVFTSDPIYSGADYVLGIPNRPKYTVYLAKGARIYANSESNQFGDETQEQDSYLAVPVHLRTGSNDMQSPLTYKEFGVGLFDYDTQNDITVTPYYESQTVAGTPFILPATIERVTLSKDLSDFYSRNIAYDFKWEGPGTVHRVVTLYRQDEEETIHWEHPATSFGIPGWKHIRDGYFGLRSTADVTLRVVVDGDEFTYNLPSTDGSRSKVYVKFKPTKGKMYRFFLDSEEPFRTYASDTYLYVKKWQTGNTYQPIPIGGSGGGF